MTKRDRYRAKIFRNGGSQAIRLPKDCRFPDDAQEVLVHRHGEKIVLEPSDKWPAEFIETLGSLADVEIPRPPQTPITDTRHPFA